MAKKPKARFSEVDEYIERVIRAALELYPSRVKFEERLRAWANRNIRPILEKFNPRFPSDMLRESVALSAICDEQFFWTTLGIELPDVCTISYIKDLLPTCCREVQVRVVPGVTLSGNWGKHSNVYWVLHYKNLSYPFALNVKRFCDMDDLNNHSEECPQRLDDSDPDYSGDCNCEPWVEVDETGVFKLDSSGRGYRCRANARKEIVKFLHKTLGV